MSYAESQVCLVAADAALTRGQCRQAVDHYAAVVTGLRPQIDPRRSLTPATTALVVHYAAASRGQGRALARLGAAGPAEQVLLTALAQLRGCLHNLGTPLAQRALLLTAYKHCFYALAELYGAAGELAKLTGYVRRHGAEVTRWAADLHLVRAASGTN